MSPGFGHGGLRLYLLRLLEDEPRHGYELIRLLEDRFLGLYSPSPGTVYPRLAQLERDGLVEHDEQGGRKVYRLTGPGREELARRGGELAGLERRVLGSVGQDADVGDRFDPAHTADAVRDAARDVAREVRDDVHSAVRDLRAELRAAARDVRHEQRRDRRTAPLAPELDELDAALSAFRVDVLAAARSHRAGAAAVARVVQVLREVRVQLAPLLAGVSPAARAPAPTSPAPTAPAPAGADGAATADGPGPVLGEEDGSGPADADL